MNAELKQLIDAIALQPDLNQGTVDDMMARAFSLATTAEERREAGAYLSDALAKRKRPDVNVREMLGDVGEALNLSYIAKEYFNKDRTWLYQRLNHSMVNGKPAAFTQAELKRLSDSLDELSNKIHQISVQLTH